MHIKRNIRPAQPGESKLLSELAYRSKSHWGYSNSFMLDCRDELTYTEQNITEHTMFVTEDKGLLAGFYSLARISPTEIELDALFVEPGYIGKGYGRLLMEHAIAIAGKMGGRYLTIQGDPNATGFYQKCGCELIGERESASIPGRFLPLFSINLDQEPTER